jgi:hypothetical protein
MYKQINLEKQNSSSSRTLADYRAEIQNAWLVKTRAG